MMLVCDWPHFDWTKSLVCKDAFHRESTIQKCFRWFCTVLQVRDIGSLPAVRMTCHPVWTFIGPQFHPSRLRAIPSGRPTNQSIIRLDDVNFCPDTHLHREASVPACIRSNVSAARPDDSQWSSFRFSFQVQIREESQFKFNRPDASLPWSECALNRYGNCVQKINRPDGHPPGPDPRSLCKEITCSGRMTVRKTVPHCPDAALKQERFLVKIWEFWLHNYPFGRPMSTVRTAPIFIKAVAHLNPQPINRGPWALRTARIR
jgi:hypothetical protein